MPGPPGEEKENTLSEEEKNRLLENEKFIESVKVFNKDYGENLIIQFKDFDTNEIVFNVYIRINEEELIYFEPMLPSETPKEDVKVELDVNKLLDIVEYEESGRIELESPPWDQKPRVGFVKNAVDGVRMFFMFRSLINSAVVTPQSAENDILFFFVRNFFEVVMGGEEDHEQEDIEELDKALEKFPEFQEQQERE